MTIYTRKQRLQLSDQQSDPFATQGSSSEDPFASEGIQTVDREGQPVAPSVPEDQTPEPGPAPESSEPVDPSVVAAPVPPENAAPASEPEEAQEGAQAPVEPETEADTAPATQTASTGPRGGKGELRHYKIAYQTGPTTWEFHKLDKVPQGIDTETVDGELWVRARNNEHALRLGFAIVGAPGEGATVWPVPKGAFKPKRVAPAPPKPERTRLVIG
jgi:hypothetical protein